MRKLFKIGLGVILVLVLAVTLAFATSFRDDNVFSGINVFEKLVKFTSGQVAYRGITYTYPAADGSNAQVLQTDGSGTFSWVSNGSGTLYSAIGDPIADTTIAFANDEINVHTYADVNEDMFNIQGIGAFGDVSIVRIEQKTGAATDGTVLEVVSADANVDPFVASANGKANAFVVGQDGNVTTANTAILATATVSVLMDINETLDVDLDANDEFVTVDSAAADYAAGSGIVTIYDDSTGQTNESFLLRLVREGDGDAQDAFILLQDNSTGAAANGDDMFRVLANGAVIMGGADGSGGKLAYSYEVLAAESGGTAASIVVVTSFVTTNGDSDEDAITLANGTNIGQIKIFVSSVETAGGDSYKVTPVSLNGGTQITFDGVVGDGCTMQWDGTAWNIISNNGGTIA
jgi:hypothetical protein